MGLDFTHSIDIARPAAEVFAFVADFENNPRWQKGMRACRWTSAERMAVGSTYVQEARFLGRRIETHFRVSELEAGRRIGIESTQSTFPIQVTRSVEARPGGCRVTAHIRGQPTGLMALMSGLVRGSVRRDYLRLKAMLEADDQRPMTSDRQPVTGGDDPRRRAADDPVG
ncbi:MAG: SRPBCC family protein [Myxococcales bacterium]|nr:SRPBCC family protein [Myxococcales bacterium]